MNSKARMTFRFDAPRPPDKPAAQRPAEPNERTETGELQRMDAAAGIAHAGPLQDDIYALEEMIRRAEPMTYPAAPVGHSRGQAAPRRPADRSLSGPMGGRRPDRPIPPEPEPNPNPNLNPNPYESAERGERNVGGGALPPFDDRNVYGRTPARPIVETYPRDRPPWWRVIAWVTGAVATGMLFGYILLTLFAGNIEWTGSGSLPDSLPDDRPQPSDVAAAPDGQQPASPAAADPQDGDEPAVGGDGGVAARTVAADTMYMLQYGVFRSEASMETAVSELRSKGLPAATNTADGYRVYVGAAASKEDAERLTGQLSGLEVFVKPLEAEELQLDGTAEAGQLAEFLTRTSELTRLMTRLTVEALEDKQPQPLAEAEASALRETLAQWQAEAAKLPKLSGDADLIVRHMNEAASAVGEYESKPSRFHLWNAQAHLMNAIIADWRLRDGMRS